MKKISYLRHVITCLLLFALVAGCQEGQDGQQSVKPKRSGSARISSSNSTVESELQSMEITYGIEFTDQEVQAIDGRPDPIEIVSRIREALEKWGYQAQTWYEQKIKEYHDRMAGITTAERATLAGTTYGYRLGLILYVLNAFEATSATSNRYGTEYANCPFCKGNAFKHAYFRVADAFTFGRTNSVNLGINHENGSSSLEAQMDRYNNARGIEVYDTFSNSSYFSSNWKDEIANRMTSGNLKYMKTATGDVNGNLTPTNL
jgi:hypothetical protein